MKIKYRLSGTTSIPKGKAATYKFTAFETKKVKNVVAFLNTHAIIPCIVKNGHRLTDNVSEILPWVRLDVDAKGEAKKIDKAIKGLHYIKKPSTSNDGKVNKYKFHYYIPVKNVTNSYNAYKILYYKFLNEFGIGWLKDKSLASVVQNTNPRGEDGIARTVVNNGKVWKAPNIKEPKQPKLKAKHSDISKVAVKKALDTLDPDMEYDKWLKVGMALYDWCPKKGLKLFDKWSRGGAKYDGTTRDKWHDFNGGSLNGTVTIGTLLYHAYGEREDPIKLFKVEKVEKVEKGEKIRPTKLEFDPKWFPEVIRNYATNISDAKGFPFGAVIPSIFTSIAATVGDKPKINVGWETSLHVWGLLVGASGARKSGIMSAGMKGFNKLLKSKQHDHAKKIARWQDKTDDLQNEVKRINKKIDNLIEKEGKEFNDPVVESWRKKRETIREQVRETEAAPPQGTVGMFEDVTDAALSKLLRQHESGILGYYPEGGSLASLMNSKGGHTETLRQIYLKGYAGEGHSVHRSTLDDIILDKINISLLAAIQPDVLSGLQNTGLADGLMGRFQFMYSLDSKQVSGAFEESGVSVDENAVRAFEDMFEDISTKRMDKTYKVGKKGMKMLREFERGYRANEYTGVRGEYMGKISYSLASIILMFHILTEGDNLEVSTKTVKNAINVMRVFISHAEYIYTTKSSDEVSPKHTRIEKLVNYLKTHKKKGQTIRSIVTNSHLNRTHGSYAKIDEVKEAILILGGTTKGKLVIWD